MLTGLDIENFQSLKRLLVNLGKFTVIVGATGSGKSAVLRALRLLAFNARGTSYITRGEKSCRVQVTDNVIELDGMGDEGFTVGIERGGRGNDAYRLRFIQMGEPYDETYTKLGGQVPAKVSQCLELSELNFAAQFDRPFLLDSSGGEIARVLGRLTNVTLLFDAAREANRRRLQVMGDLKRAEVNLSSLTEAAQKFRGMKERHAAVSEAEEALERARHLSVQAGRLNILTAHLEDAQGALKAAAPPEVPDGARLEELAGRLYRVRDLDSVREVSTLDAQDAMRRVQYAADNERAAHKRLHEALVESGQCPTCGSVIT